MPCTQLLTEQRTRIDVVDFWKLTDADIEKLFKLSGPIARMLAEGTISREPEPETTAHVTELIVNHRKGILKRREPFAVRLRDQLWATWGQAVHRQLQDFAVGNSESEALSEHNMLHTFKCGITVTGTLDFELDLVQDDYKTTSAWGGKRLNDAMNRHGDYSSEQKSWWRQLDFYKAMAHLEDGRVIKKQRVWAFFRDWSPSQAAKYRTYPSEPICRYDHPNEHSVEYCEDALEAAAFAWSDAIKLPSEQLPKCQDEWGRGMLTYCSYCPVTDRCTQYKAEVAANG